MRLRTGVTLLLLALAGRAEAFSEDRDVWLKAYQEKATHVFAWAKGVAETLTLVAGVHGCTGITAVSGNTLANATADLLRQTPTMDPMVGALLAFGRLSGCEDAVARGLRAPEWKNARFAGQAEADGRWGVWAVSVHRGEARDATSEFAPGPFDSRDACRLVALEAGVKYLSTLAHTNAVHQMAERGNRPFPPFVTYECREVTTR